MRYVHWSIVLFSIPFLGACSLLAKKDKEIDSKKIAVETTNQKKTENLVKTLEKKIKQLEAENKTLTSILEATKQQSSRLPETQAEGKLDHVLYRKALEAAARENREELLRLITLYQKISPPVSLIADLKLRLAHLESKVGDPIQALSILNDVLQLQITNLQKQNALLQKGKVYSQLNLTEMANQTYKELIQRFPNSFEATEASIHIKKTAVVERNTAP